MSTILLVFYLIVVAWFAVYYLGRKFDLESKGIEVGPGMATWRTERGIGVLDRIANWSKSFWKIFGLVGVVLGFFLMWRMFSLLSEQAFSMIQSFTETASVAGGAGGGGGGGVMPIIPGVTTPLLAGAIALVATVFVHEGAHGITARRAGLPVESTGLGVLLFLPIAFVEPEEEKLGEASISDKLQVFGAGSFANILLALTCFGLILSLVIPLPGLYINGVYEDSAADGELIPGGRILEVGMMGGPTHKINERQDLGDFMENTRPSDDIVIVTTSGTHSLTLGEYPKPGENALVYMEDENRIIEFGESSYENEGFIGVSGLYYSSSRTDLVKGTFVSIFTFWKSPSIGGGLNQYAYDFRIPSALLGILTWIFIFNFGVGLFNLLPLLPLDGGRMLSSLLEKATSSSIARYVTLTISGITAAIILITLLPWLMMLW